MKIRMALIVDTEKQKKLLEGVNEEILMVVDVCPKAEDYLDYNDVRILNVGEETKEKLLKFRKAMRLRGKGVGEIIIPRDGVQLNLETWK